MGKFLKAVLYAIGAFVALLLIVGIAVSLTFDPNEYRDDIAAAVLDETGRELVIEGDLDISFFPWLAIEVGRTTLGNAEGFGDEPFMRFDSARLGVQLMPLILRRDVAVGNAAIDGLRLNLMVASNGRSNWQDFAEIEDEPPATASDAGRDQAIEQARQSRRGAINVASVSVSDAALRYVDEQLGERYELSNLNISTGSVSRSEPIEIRGSLDFSAQPAGTSGSVALETSIAFDDENASIRFDGFDVSGSIDGLADVPARFSFNAPAIEINTADSIANVGSVEVSVFDVRVAADVEAFSYAGSVEPIATIRIDAFSPRSLMRTLAIEGPETADPAALGKLRIDARAAVTGNQVSLSNLELVVDDTTFRGELVVPRESGGAFRLNLAGDTIDLNRYMAPASEAAAGAAAGDDAALEIPAELIRAINARGSLTLASASLGGMLFENVEVGLNSSNGQLRIHPLKAQFFDGAYSGDIRINAAGNTPVLTVNEQIENVSMNALGRAMYERDNITGTINGSFSLSGRGNDMAEIQRTLSGNLSFTLQDGAYEGVDLWWQMRRARALFKQQEPPPRPQPARTRFSEVRATGTVTDGVLRNDDFFAELPFMQLNGRGSVNLPAATVDYSLSGRVFDRPEYMPADVTAGELEDLTKAVIPLRITGQLASPSVSVDVEQLLRERVQEQVEDRLKDALRNLLERD